MFKADGTPENVIVASAVPSPAEKDNPVNVLIILLPVYFLQGLAVVESFLARKGLAPALRALTYLFLLVINPLPMIVTGLGVFDLWADFRKPRLRDND